MLDRRIERLHDSGANRRRSRVPRRVTSNDGTDSFVGDADLSAGGAGAHVRVGFGPFPRIENAVHMSGNEVSVSEAVHGHFERSRPCARAYACRA
jgi:hypothetical protein